MTTRARNFSVSTDEVIEATRGIPRVPTNLEFATIFATTIARIDGKQFLPLADSLYEVCPPKKAEALNLSTTLKSYLFGEASITDAVPESEDLNKFKQFLVDMGRAYLKGMGYASEKYGFKVASMWLTSMVSGDDHPPHSHCGPIISGCFYVDVPAGSGGITFMSPLLHANTVTIGHVDTNPNTQRKCTVLPSAGDIFMWESHLFHYVGPAQFQGARKSIAFDIAITNLVDE